MLARNNEAHEYRLLDAPKVDGSTLGMRRLMYSAAPTIENYKLYKLSVPVHRYADIFVYLEKCDSFIDSSGKIIKYVRSMNVPLKYHKIVKFREIPTGYLIYAQYIHTPFYINREPQLEDHYVGLLHIGKGYVLYSTEPTKLADTRRKI
jgi:hypothetical protein